VAQAWYAEESCCRDDTYCQDGSWCNGHEICNCWGECEDGSPIDCDDDNACTRDWCDDGAPGDNRGQCRHVDVVVCDDSNECTTDACDPATGSCDYIPVAAGQPCDDGVVCTTGDQCDGAGNCVGTGTSCPPDPNCPTATCDVALGRCTYSCGRTFDDHDDWETGRSDSVSTNPPNPLHPDCADPDTICLDSTVSDSRYIWIPNTDSRTIAKLDVDTGAMEPGFPRASLGGAPSRTVQDPRDGSVWLGNRGWADPTNPNESNIVHFAPDGRVICWTGLPGMVRAVAIDSDYNVWAGLWGTSTDHGGWYWEGQVVKFSGTATDPGPTYPRCRELRRWNWGSGNGPNGQPYGAAGDAAGNVWFVINGTWGNNFDSRYQSLFRISKDDPGSGATRQWFVPPPGRVGGCFSTYGIAVDGRRRVWIGSYGCAKVILYDPAVGGGAGWSARDIPQGNPRGIAIAADGWAYTSLHNRYVARVASDLSSHGIIDLGATVSISCGTAIDHRARVWGVNYSNNACRVDVSRWPAYVVSCFGSGGNTPYAYTDMTGMQHLLFTAPRGTWTVQIDSGSAATVWTAVRWTAFEIPGVTDVAARARAANTRAGLASAAWYPAAPGGITTSPADIRPMVPNPAQWGEIEMILTTGDPAQTPVLYDVTVDWTR
jgi:hypothetical protein